MPLITGGATAGSTVLTGVGDPSPPCDPGDIVVKDCGPEPENICYDGNDTDIATIKVTRDAQGNFIIVLLQPLAAGQKVYVADRCKDPLLEGHGLGRATVVQATTSAPVLSRVSIVLLVAALGLVAWLGLTRLRWSS